jgi:hypothetical protein
MRVHSCLLPPIFQWTCAQQARWFPDEAVEVYASEYSRTGFQGGLNDYRLSAVDFPDTAAFAGATLRVPSCFIAGCENYTHISFICAI